MRCAAKSFDHPARFQTVVQALAATPMFFADLVEAIGSEDSREVALASTHCGKRAASAATTTRSRSA